MVFFVLSIISVRSESNILFYTWTLAKWLCTCCKMLYTVFIFTLSLWHYQTEQRVSTGQHKSITVIMRWTSNLLDQNKVYLKFLSQLLSQHTSSAQTKTTFTKLWIASSHTVILRNWTYFIIACRIVHAWLHHLIEQAKLLARNVILNSLYVYTDYELFGALALSLAGKKQKKILETRRVGILFSK